MKILHTADWHLGRKIEGRNRHDEQVDVLNEICEIVEEEDVDAILIAGDVYDSYNPPAESEGLYYETLTRLSDGGRRAVVVIAGNHDSPDRLTAANPYGKVLGITTVGVPKETPPTYDGGSGKSACLSSYHSFIRLRLRNDKPLSILALPYPSESRLNEVIAETIDTPQATESFNQRIAEFMAEVSSNFVDGEPNIIMSHLFVRGGIESDSERLINVGGTYAVSPSSFPVEADYVALGHLHRPQEFTGDDDLPIRYAGSPLQYSFSEAGQQKSVTLLTCEHDEIHHRPISLSSGRTLIHNPRIQGVQELERFLHESDNDAYLSFVVTLEEPLEPGYAEALQKQHPNILKPLFTYKERLSDREELSIQDSSPRDQFVRFVRSKGEEPADEVVDLFCTIIGENNETG